MYFLGIYQRDSRYPFYNQRYYDIGHLNTLPNERNHYHCCNKKDKGHQLFCTGYNCL